MEFGFGQPLAYNAIALEGHGATTQVGIQLEINFQSFLTDDKKCLGELAADLPLRIFLENV